MGHRALPLLVAVAMPALAFGQNAGQLTASPSEVGQAKCSSTSATDDITLAWTIDTSKSGSPATGDTYLVAVYASGTACPDPSAAPASSASNVVVSRLAATGNTQSTAVTVDALAVAGSVACPTPWAAASDQTEVLCVYLENSSNVAQGTGVAASGTFLFQLARPPAPVLTSVDPANGALIANFQAGTSGTPNPLDTATSASYRADAYLSGVLVSSATGTSSPIRVEGLTNSTSSNPITYDVDVVALSASPASNESVASNSMPGSPLPFDSFWTAYQNAGGREQGGCGGGAGALSLLALLPLVLGRRRP